MINILVVSAVAGLVYFGWHVYKATKDPDVQAAADLRMTITRFKRYERLYDAYSAFMQEHGIDTPESEEYFVKTIWPQIKNPNEWRRYQRYRAER